MLRVGAQPGHGDADVAVQYVAGLDDRVVAEVARGHALALHFDARLEPCAQALVVRSASRNFAVQVAPSASLMPCRSPLDRPSVKANVFERLMPITRGCTPRSPAPAPGHCSSPHDSACQPPTAGVTPLVDVRAWNTPPCDVPPRAVRSMQLAETGLGAAAHVSKNM